MDETIAKELLAYIAQNMITESRYLSSNPMTSVEIIGLLDKIAELRNLSITDNGREFNKIVDFYEEQHNNQKG